MQVLDSHVVLFAFEQEPQLDVGIRDSSELGGVANPDPFRVEASRNLPSCPAGEGF